MDKQYGVIRSSFKSMGKGLSYSSFITDTHQGVRIRGEFFLDAITTVNMVSTVATTTGTRLVEQYYIHPSMLYGRPAALAATFTHYCFEKLVLTYVPMVPTSQSGMIHLMMTEDVNINPSVLIDRQLRVWFESLDANYAGPLYSLPRDATIRHTCTTGDLFRVVREGSDLSQIYQGKILVAVSGTPVNINLGEVKLAFDLILADDLLTIGGVQKNVPTGEGLGIFSLTATDAGDPVVCSLPMSLSTGTVNGGVYSLQVARPVDDQEHAAQEAGWLSQAIRTGTEFIADLLPVGGNLVGSIFSSVNDFLGGNPIKAVSAGTSATGNSFKTAINLIPNLLPLLFGTVQSGQGAIEMLCRTDPGLKAGRRVTLRTLHKAYVTGSLKDSLQLQALFGFRGRQTPDDIRFLSDNHVARHEAFKAQELREYLDDIDSDIDEDPQWTGEGNYPQPSRGNSDENVSSPRVRDLGQPVESRITSGVTGGISPQHSPITPFRVPPNLLLPGGAKRLEKS